MKLWLYGLFGVLKTLYGAVILWSDHFLDSWAEIHQIFALVFFWKFKTPKSQSEINWPLKEANTQLTQLKVEALEIKNRTRQSQVPQNTEQNQSANSMQ